jgi:hypothetical protein
VTEATRASRSTVNAGMYYYSANMHEQLLPFLSLEFVRDTYRTKAGGETKIDADPHARATNKACSHCLIRHGAQGSSGCSFISSKLTL